MLPDADVMLDILRRVAGVAAQVPFSPSESKVMRIHIAAFALIMALCAANSLARRAGPALDTPDSCSEAVYGNPEDTRDPLNPSNKGLKPRVVDAAGKAISFPLKASGAQLYYGDGQPMRTPQGAPTPQSAPVRATGSVYLNYGIRLERDGRTYFMAWRTDPEDPAGSPEKNATGWVAADDMTEHGAKAAKAAIPCRLAGRVERPLAKDASGKPLTFVVNGTNERAKAAAGLEMAYIGVANHNRDQVINFLNLHDGRAGLQMLVNLPNVRGGGIAEDCFPNGTSFTAAAGASGDFITVSIPVFDKRGAEHVLTFIYGRAGETWGWMVKDWLDEPPH
jgi:hypothetical protein